MTKRVLMDMLVDNSQEYVEGAVSSLKRNSHMNELKGGGVPTIIIEAVVTDFVNFIAMKQGMDLGLYTSDLKKDETRENL